MKGYAKPLRQIEPMLSDLEQVIGLIADREFENIKGLACRRLIIQRKKHGASAGFRIDRDPHGIQADQPLTDADRDKIEQELRKSATSRNQESDKEGA
jgi:hypothetical protein